MSNRLDKERETELQPKRIEYAATKLRELGYDKLEIDNTKIKFSHQGHPCVLFPYSGWHTGKSIKDGRGIQNLFNQLTSNNH